MDRTSRLAVGFGMRVTKLLPCHTSSGIDSVRLRNKEVHAGI